MSALTEAPQRGTRLSPRRPTISIYPHKGWQAIRLGELWHNRDLVFLLCLRDITVRYKQAALGIAWAVIQPLMKMVVMNAIFGRLAGMGNQFRASGIDAPYPIVLFSGLIAWEFFNSAVNSCSNSLVSNANMLRKVYVPRLALPIASLGAPMADLCFSFLVLIGLMLYYGTPFSLQLLLIPALILSSIFAVLSVGLLLAALSVRYRDFRFVIPFALQIAFFLTPVIYPADKMTGYTRIAMQLNPMTGPVEAFRAAVLGTPIPYENWGYSMMVAALLLLTGLIYFSRVERQFADVV